MNKNSYVVRVLVNGRSVQEFEKDNQVYIEGRIGSQYSIEVKNPCYTRMLAVVTIDGVNVISGKPSSENDHMGYIINGNSSTVIEGFRKDKETVGKFKFCQKSKSYCNEKGLDGNNGVIGVRIYGEAFKYIESTAVPYIPPVPVVPYAPHRNGYIPWDNYNYCSSTTNTNGDVYTSSVLNGVSKTVSSTSYASCLRESAPLTEKVDAFNVGTTWGEQKTSSVDFVNFDVGSLLQEFLIYYASMKGLQKLGVPIKKKAQVVYPKAFGNFAEPPKGWRG
ncbi:MAG: hypothetical protein O2794_04515 [bacterium]|nr:hypothetical protein [bacterium]